jgi:hypothetical protein
MHRCRMRSPRAKSRFWWWERLPEGRAEAKAKGQKAKGKRQKAKGKRQKAKGKRQKAKGKRQKEARRSAQTFNK